VAGRFGHGGGGTTTLKTYSARPVGQDSVERARTEPRYPYEVTAVALASLIDDHALPLGSFVPPASEVAEAHRVSLSTAKRALGLLQDWGKVARVGRNH